MAVGLTQTRRLYCYIGRSGGEFTVIC